MDVIDVIEEAEGCSKAEAINRAKAMAGELPKVTATANAKPNREVAEEAARAAVLARAWATMKAGVAMSSVAKGYLESRGLDYRALDAAGGAVGYNPGQMHYGERRDEAFVASCLWWGLPTARTAITTARASQVSASAA